jgi:hypothetical protein
MAKEIETESAGTSNPVDAIKAGLAEVLKKYAVPDPKIVSVLPKGGVKLDFVGHADITRILIEIDPLWYWEPIKFDEDGLPAYRVENGMAHMAGRLCILGVERIAIGSAAHNKPDLLKELASDFIRNGAMRFGISLSLWTKNEWEDLDTHIKPGVGKPKPYPATGAASKQLQMPMPSPTKGATSVDKETGKVLHLPTVETSKAKHPSNTPTKQQIDFINKAATEFGDPVEVCKDIIERPIASISDLTVDEMKVINENLKQRKAK